MKKFYVASGLANAELAASMIKAIEAVGAECTYNWTKVGSVQHDFNLLQNTAIREINGAVEADFVVVMLPGGRGTHGELGAALATGTPVILYSQNLGVFGTGKETSVFYHHPLVQEAGTVGEVLEQVRTFLFGLGQEPARYQSTLNWPMVAGQYDPES